MILDGGCCYNSIGQYLTEIKYIKPRASFHFLDAVGETKPVMNKVERVVWSSIGICVVNSISDRYI